MTVAGTANDERAEPFPDRRGLKKGLYLLPSGFTAANIGMGFFAVMNTLRGFRELNMADGGATTRAALLFDGAAIAIGWAVLFDMLDGRIARLTRTTTEFGVQLDSIADVITFGIAPTVLVFAWGYGSAFSEGSLPHNFGWLLSFMYLICGAFRLARFNVQAARPRVLAEGLMKLDKKSFIGLPIPAAALLIAAIVHFSPTPLARYEPRLAVLYSGLMIGLVGCLSALMVSTLRYSNFKTVGTRKRSARVMLLIVAAVGMLIYLNSQYVLLAVTTAYVIHGPIMRLGAMVQSRQGKPAKKIEVDA